MLITIKLCFTTVTTNTCTLRYERYNRYKFNLCDIFAIYNQIQSCPATTRPVITLIGCNAVGRASRFFRPLGFFLFLSCIYFWTANCFIFYVLCHDVLLALCLLYIYSYLFYCFMSENSSLELMFMFIQPTLSFLYALLVSRVGKYD